jgi:hypothetical protein
VSPQAVAREGPKFEGRKQVRRVQRPVQRCRNRAFALVRCQRVQTFDVSLIQARNSCPFVRLTLEMKIETYHPFHVHHGV